MAGRDRSILRLKAKGMSNRWIGGRFGLDEKTIRKTLRRLGWKPAPQPTLPLLPKIDSHASPVVVDDSSLNQIPTSAASPSPPKSEKPESSHPACNSLDPNPLDRSADRLLAALGLLDDAAPLFAPARNLPRAGVLLAIPALVASGLLSAAEKIYGSLGPSFYGLRTTLVAYILLALLRIPRPEALKEYRSRRTGPHRGFGPHAGSQNLAPQTDPSGGLQSQPSNWAGRSLVSASENMATCSASSTSTVMCAPITVNTPFLKPM